MAPTTLAGPIATDVSFVQIDLSWTGSTDNVGVAGYKIERSPDGSTNWSQVATSTSTTYSDASLSDSTTYYYRVRAYDEAGNNSDYSNAASATTPQPPASVTRYEQTDPSVSWLGTGWKDFAAASYSGGSTKYSLTAGNRATFSFTGVSISWIACKTTYRGIAKVYVDGVYEANIDLYSTTTLFQQKVFNKTGLCNGPHTITIEVTGTKNPSAGNCAIDVDAFDVETEN